MASKFVMLNGAMGAVSLAIQIGILVPWHDVISEQVDRLETETVALRKRIAELQSAESRVSTAVTQAQTAVPMPQTMIAAVPMAHSVERTAVTANSTNNKKPWLYSLFW